ncbi:TPA: molybdopterin-dependent oxidoreductase, partial [Escherichia coli]|nr:molybdopterin-dependent oxidoreductase [Escherichia coli]HAW2942341.1 molybdopterin-dependent oxidoreductase [Escherichia coli]
MLIQIGRPRERTGWTYSIIMVNVSHIRTLSSIESTTSSPSIRLTMESIWNYAGNTLVNQHSDINKTHEILQGESKCEMIVVIENFMTSSAKY